MLNLHDIWLCSCIVTPPCCVARDGGYTQDRHGGGLDDTCIFDSVKAPDMPNNPVRKGHNS